MKAVSRTVTVIVAGLMITTAVASTASAGCVDLTTKPAGGPWLTHAAYRSGPVTLVAYQDRTATGTAMIARRSSACGSSRSYQKGMRTIHHPCPIRRTLRRWTPDSPNGTATGRKS